MRSDVENDKERSLSLKSCDGCSICECDGAGPVEKWVSAMRRQAIYPAAHLARVSISEQR